MPQWEKKDPDKAWKRCRELAYYKKCGRTSEAVESGLEVPSEEEIPDERPLSPLSRPASSGVRLQPAAVEKPEPVEKVKKSKKKDTKKKKKKDKSSSSSQEPSAPRSNKAKKVVINIG